MQRSKSNLRQLFGLSIALILVLFLVDLVFNLLAPVIARASSLKLQSQYPFQTATYVTRNPYPGIGTSTSTVIPGATSTFLPGTTSPPTSTPLLNPTFATDTPVASWIAPTEVGTGGPTTTLIPFPSITILFPETATPEPIRLDEGAHTQATPIKDRLWPLALLGLAWIFIVLLFFYLRRNFR